MGKVWEHGYHGGGTPAAMALAVRADDEYDAALATLLTEAGRRPGLLVRIGQRVLAALRALHTRKCEDAEQLEPWYWYLDC